MVNILSTRFAAVVQEAPTSGAAAVETEPPAAELAGRLRAWGFAKEAEQAGALHDVDSLLQFGRV